MVSSQGMKLSPRRFWSLLVVVLVYPLGCAEAPTRETDPATLARIFPRVVTPDALQRKLAQLQSAFEARFALAQLPPRLSRILEAMAEKLLTEKSLPQMRSTQGELATRVERPQVHLIEHARFGEAGVWAAYAWPPAHLYIPRAILSALFTESEVAALMALLLVSIGPVPPDYSAGGAPLPDLVGAIALLYRAGYDPRGLLSLGRRYQDFGERSPYAAAILQNWIELSQQEISAYPPLRRPLVNSAEFLHARYEWLMKLKKITRLSLEWPGHLP